MKNTWALSAAAAVASLAQPVSAEENHILAVQSANRAPAGFSTTIGIRVPLGSESKRRERVTYNLTSAYGHRFESAVPLQMDRTRRVELVRVNFDNDGARDMKLANLNLTQFGRKDVEGNRLNIGGKGTTIAIVGAVVLVGVILLAVASTPPDY